MKTIITFFLAVLLALVEQASAQTPKPIRTLVSPNPAQDGEFGYTITTVGGNNILVGAPGRSGAAYLFDGRNGKLLRTFQNPTPGRGDRFGAAVAAFGDDVLIGAPFDDNDGKDGGIVYLFDTTTGDTIRSFQNPTPGDSALFGYSIASAGNKILIGAPSYDFFAQKIRKGTVYEFDGVTGNLLRTFQNLNGAKASEFGYSVAMSENRIIVGAPGDTLQGNLFIVGRIHIFDENSGELLFILPRGDQRCPDYRFGSSVVFFNNSLLVGATGGIVVDEGGEATNGTVSRFEIDTGSLLTCFSPSPFASIPAFRFGRSIAGIGDKIIVGSPSENFYGAVHIFNDATGNLQQKIFSPRQEEGFGYSVAALDELIIVGAPFHINAGSTGVVYLFSTAPINCSLSITSPRNGAAICNSSVNVKTSTRIIGGIPPFNIQCEINGVRATVTDTTATAIVPLSIGENALVATCTVVDSSGNQAVCLDSIRVIGCDPNQSLREAAVSPFPIASGRFGSAVAAFGNNILVGAPGDNVKGIRAGAAYLIDTAKENILRTFSNPVPAAGDSFGFSIAVAGNNILIGAPFFDNKDDDSGNVTALDVGRAFLFDGNTGALLRTFRKAVPTTNDQFGYSVALLGNNVVIGAPRDDAGAADAGSVYLFNATTGELLRTIPNPQPGNTDFFGSSLAVIGNNLIVGTPSDGDAQVADAGSAYVFDISTGQLLRTLQNQPRIGGAALGTAMAAFGNNILLGAPGGTGAVYLFDITTGNVITTFLNPTPTVNNAFGASIATIGNNVLIGAPGDDAEANDAGRAYLFNGTSGTLLQTFKNPAPAVGDRFGFAVAGGINKAIVGTPFDDLAGPDAGAVYVFNAAQFTGPLDGLEQNRAGTFQTILDNPRIDPRLKATGFPNTLINPGETVSVKIQLQNFSDKPTGAFFGILRPLDAIVTMIDSTANFAPIAGNGATGFSATPYVFKVDSVILPDSLKFKLVMIQKSRSPKPGKATPAGLDESSSLSAVSVRIIFIVLPTANITFDIVYNLSLHRTSKPDSNLFRFGYKLIFAGPSEDYTATNTQISINKQTLNNMIFFDVLLDAPQELGDIDPSNPEVSEEILFNLAQSFQEDQPSSFDLLMSWFEPCTGCPALPNVPSGTRPISGGATITSALLDSLLISGQIVYYQADNFGIKRPIRDANILVKRPNATLFAPPFPSTTPANIAANKTNFSGFFSFKVGKNDTGTYKIYATRPANTVPTGAVTAADGRHATGLITTPPLPRAKDAVFKQIAADVDRDSMITDCDVKGILNQPLPITCAQPIRQGWTFVDAFTPVRNATFFRAQDTLTFKVKNYGKHVNFVGIVYGDVDGSAGNLLPPPPPGFIVASNPKHPLEAVNKSAPNIPQEFFLSQNYPNPFNPTTRIEYGLPNDEQVRLQIFNVVGQVVYTCVDQSQKAGYYKVDWNGRDQNGKPAPAGIYLMRLQAGAYSQVRKLALVK